MLSALISAYIYISWTLLGVPSIYYNLKMFHGQLSSENADPELSKNIFLPGKEKKSKIFVSWGQSCHLFWWTLIISGVEWPIDIKVIQTVFTKESSALGSYPWRSLEVIGGFRRRTVRLWEGQTGHLGQGEASVGARGSWRVKHSKMGRQVSTQVEKQELIK